MLTSTFRYDTGKWKTGFKGRDTPDAIRQAGAIFRLSLTDNFDRGLSFSNI
jgi:hypothetical protein